MTPRQLQIIHTAQRQLKLEDGQYRMILKNVADVASSKDLTNSTFEQVMAFLEDLGFSPNGQPSTYWRDKVASRQSGEVTERQLQLIGALAADASIDAAGFAWRMSNHRTRTPGELSSREAYNVIEALKQIVDRNASNREDAKTRREAPPSLFNPGEFRSPSHAPDAGDVLRAATVRERPILGIADAVRSVLSEAKGQRSEEITIAGVTSIDDVDDIPF